MSVLGSIVVYIMSGWLFNVYIDAVMEVKMGMGRRGVRFQERRVEIVWPLVCRGLGFV